MNSSKNGLLLELLNLKSKRISVGEAIQISIVEVSLSYMNIKEIPLRRSFKTAFPCPETLFDVIFAYLNDTSYYIHFNALSFPWLNSALTKLTRYAPSCGQVDSLAH